MLRQQKLLHLKFILQLSLLQKGKVCFILPVSLKQDPDEPIVKVKTRVMRPVVAHPFRKGVKQGPKHMANLKCLLPRKISQNRLRTI
uniref:Uncharacterized protein n=1 Tax=Solanum tuberosum TaxID=4113 RepID=M1BTI8_SOLTU